MDLTDDDQQPIRTREELLAHVEQRGNDLRRRRRAGRTLAGIAAMLAVTALGGLADAPVSWSLEAHPVETTTSFRLVP